MTKNLALFINNRLIQVRQIDEVIAIFEQGSRDKSSIVVILDEDVKVLHNKKDIEVPEGIRSWTIDKMAVHFEKIL